MLKTPNFKHLDLAKEFGFSVEILEEGAILTDLALDDISEEVINFYDFRLNIGDIPDHGICDSPDQFFKKYKEALMSDSRNLCVHFQHMEKDPQVGFRWHKWGKYIGEGIPDDEYLYKSSGFENGVFVFDICQLKG
jgi:hypothetical protein